MPYSTKPNKKLKHNNSNGHRVILKGTATLIIPRTCYEKQLGMDLKRYSKQSIAACSS